MKYKNMLYHNDQYDTSDCLGMEKAGDALALMALNVTPPFSIAVQGKWGAGKTSVMQRAFVTLGGTPLKQAVPMSQEEQSSFQSDNDHNLAIYDTHNNKDSEQTSGIIRFQALKQQGWQDHNQKIAEQSLCIWYSPWQQHSLAHPIIPLLREIQTQFNDHYKNRLHFHKAKRYLALSAESLFSKILALTEEVGYTNVQQTPKNNNKIQLELGLDSQRFHIQFEDAVKQALLSLSQTPETETEIDKNARIVIFIDDLDRCDEQTIINLLEGIKLYLNIPRCVFIFGIDKTMVLNMIQNHWPKRSPENNREYLEKLFQAQVNIPQPQADKLQAMIQTQFEQHKISAAAQYAEHVLALIEPNPRKVKNFANSLCSAWQQLENGHDFEKLMLYQYLRQYHPAIWSILERQAWSLEILIAVCRNNTVERYESLPNIYNLEDQRMLEEFFAREFSHVLAPRLLDEVSQQYETDTHQGIALEQAVEYFLERVDRKASDEYFIKRLSLLEDNEIETAYLQVL